MIMQIVHLPKRPRANLRLRIITWSFVPTTIILLAVALVTFYAYQRVTEDLVVGRNDQLTRLSAGQLAADLTSYSDTLNALARTSDFYQGDPARQSSALQQNANKFVVFDGGVIVLNHMGIVAATDAAHTMLLGQNWADRGFFRQIIHRAGTTFSDILPEEPRSIAVAVPILDERGEFRGTLVGMFRVGATGFSAFYGGIVKLRLGDGGSMYLVDSTGSVIYHSNADRIGGDVQKQPVVQRVLQRQAGSLRTRDLDNRDILATYAPVPGTPWGLVSEEDWSSLLASGRSYEQFLLVLLALGVIVPAIVVAFGVKRITDPVRRLILAAGQIAGGNFGEQIVVQTGDELEELVEQFNVMSKKLAESYADLEHRVELRTRDLTILNTIAAVVSESLDLKEIMNAALTKAMEAMRMEVGTAYSIQGGEGPDADKQLVLVARQGLSAEFSQRVGLRRVRGTAIEVAAEQQRPVVWLVADYPDPQIKSALEIEGVRQVINVPLFAKGRFVGAFNLGTRHERTVTPEELSLVAAIGHQIAIAVENALLYDQAEQSAALAERTRLARELHDSVTQSLYSVTLYAEAAQLLLTSGNPVTAAAHMRELRDTAQEALGEMRLLIYELRPLALEKSGLAVALRERLETVEARGGIKPELQVEGADHLPFALQQELYYIAREALNNVIKHAHAHRVYLRLRVVERTACLELGDDGVGFDPANVRSGLGLAGMKERVQRIGGTVEIASAVGTGTQVRVEVPL